MWKLIPTGTRGIPTPAQHSGELESDDFDTVVTEVTLSPLLLAGDTELQRLEEFPFVLYRQYHIAILGEPYIYLLTPDRDGDCGYHMRTCPAGRGVAGTDQCIGSTQHR